MNQKQESRSEIDNQLNSLSSTSLKSPNVNYMEKTKTNTVEDIINKKLDNMESYLNSKVINIYQRPWNKLELKLKLRKFAEYYESGTEVEQLTKQTKFVDLKSTMTLLEAQNALKSAKKKFKVEYDVDKCLIKSVLIEV